MEGQAGCNGVILYVTILYESPEDSASEQSPTVSALVSSPDASQLAKTRCG